MLRMSLTCLAVHASMENSRAGLIKYTHRIDISPKHEERCCSWGVSHFIPDKQPFIDCPQIWVWFTAVPVFLQSCSSTPPTLIRTKHGAAFSCLPRGRLSPFLSWSCGEVFLNAWNTSAGWQQGKLVTLTLFSVEVDHIFTTGMTAFFTLFLRVWWNKLKTIFPLNWGKHFFLFTKHDWLVSGSSLSFNAYCKMYKN